MTLKYFNGEYKGLLILSDNFENFFNAVFIGLVRNQLTMKILS